MMLTEADIEEFIALTREEDGMTLSREEAREAATRVVLLYERLLLPTPEEVTAARLAKDRARGNVSHGQVEPFTSTLT
jgi:hypothetical protein